MRSSWKYLVGLAVAGTILTACSSGSGASSAGSASTHTGDIGVAVTGAFDTKPTVTVPGDPAPTTLVQETLIHGDGALVAKGDTLIANYVGQTWATQNGKPHVFDSSFSRGTPAAFVIGTGQVIPGWDKTLVGQKLGSRELLSIPPADGYGANGQSSAGISGTDTLVFVVDLVAAYGPNASAPGTVVANIPTAGLPAITNEAGKPPTVTGVSGVVAPAAPKSTLLVKGTGAKIDDSKTLVLQLVQTDLATGKDTQSSWGTAPQTVSAQNVLSVADVLTGQAIGSRALVLAPATPAIAATATQAAQAAAPAQILIVDIVGQF